MTDDGTITNKMLLEHQQATRIEFNQKIDQLEKKMERRFAEVHDKFSEIDRKFVVVERRFEQAKKDRQNIHDDLDATIKMQSKHDRELAVLTGRPLPEDY